MKMAVCKIVAMVISALCVSSQVHAAATSCADIAGTYAATDSKAGWVPSYLRISEDGQFSWFFQFKGKAFAVGKCEAINSTVVLKSELPSGPLHFKFQDGREMSGRGGVLPLWQVVIQSGTIGVPGIEVKLVDKDGAAVANVISNIHGVALFDPPASRPWQHIAVRRANSQDAWTDIAVSSEDQFHVVELSVDNPENAPALFETAILSASDGGLNFEVQAEGTYGYAWPKITYQRSSSIVNQKKLTGRYSQEKQAGGDDQSYVLLKSNNDAELRFDYGALSVRWDGKWRYKNGMVFFDSLVPADNPYFRIRQDINVRIQPKQDELIVSAGVQGYGGVPGIGVRFEASGKEIGRATSDKNGDAIIKWNGDASEWNRIHVKKQGSKQVWSSFDVAHDSASKRIVGVSVNGHFPRFSYLEAPVASVDDDGNLILEEPFFRSLSTFKKQVDQE